MSLYTLNQRKYIVLGVTLVLGLFLAFALQSVFTALLGSIVLYTIFKPLYIFLTKKKYIYKGLSALFIILISFLIIILPLGALSIMIVNKVIEISGDPTPINKLIAQINNFGGSNFNEPQLIENLFKNAEAWILRTFSSLVNGVFEVTIKITVMYFVLYFMLVSHEQLETTLVKYMPFKRQNSVVFANELKNITYANVIGQGLISIVQGTLVGLGFYIFDIKDPFFWGVIAVLLCFLPIVGAPFIFVPAGLIALSNGDKIAGFGIIIWGFTLVTNIDNFMRFIIAKKVANIHPLIIIIGVVIGIPYFGILGLVFGPLLLSYFILMVKFYELRYVKKQDIQITDFQNHLKKE